MLRRRLWLLMVCLFALAGCGVPELSQTAQAAAAGSQAGEPVYPPPVGPTDPALPLPTSPAEESFHGRFSTRYEWGTTIAYYEANAGRGRATLRPTTIDYAFSSDTPLATPKPCDVDEQGNPLSGLALLRCQQTSYRQPSIFMHSTLVNPSPQVRIEGRYKRPEYEHVYIGNDPAYWQLFLPVYGALRYRSLYEGIELHYQHDLASVLRHTYIISPEIGPETIAWTYGITTQVALEEHGILALTTERNGYYGTYRYQAPQAWQELNGMRIDVPVGYMLDGQKVSFQVGAYDPHFPLMISMANVPPPTSIPPEIWTPTPDPAMPTVVTTAITE